MITTIPAMSLRNLARQTCEPMSYDTLRGIFADFHAKRCPRAQLVEAIRCWQITAAKEAILGDVAIVTQFFQKLSREIGGNQ